MGAVDSFLLELRRRHVYRVAVGYAAIGWLLAQVVTQVLPVFETPLWAQRLAVLVLIAGFPVALLVAWFYELTPAGFRREAPAGEARKGRRRFSRADAVILVLVAVSIVGTVILWRAQEAMKSSTEAPPVSATAGKSIAVLPFENLSPDRDNAYFAGGMQEQILTQLMRLSGLKTISRTSTEKYASHPEDVRAIGQQLGVSNVLEGSVQKMGKEARISLQLIDAANGTQVWAETYDRNLDNVFTVESDVAAKVADALQVTLLPKEQRALAKAPTENGFAYQALLRGEAAQQRADVTWKQPDIDAAISAYQEAVAADPTFALAWARLAYAYAWTIHFVPSVDAKTIAARSKQALDKALALDAKLPEAHIAAGFYHEWGEGDRTAAQAEFKQALALNPRDANAQLALADIEYSQGHLDEANVAYQHAVSLDPRNVLALQGLAWLDGERHRYAEADRILLKALDVNYHAGLTWGERDFLAYYATGSGAAQLAMIMAAPPDVRAIPTHLVDHADALYHSHEYAAALKLYTDSRGSVYSEPQLCERRADTQWQLGQRGEATAAYRHCVDLLLADREHESRANESAQLGWAYARLGRKDEAERESRHAVALVPVARNWQGGAEMLMNLARVEAQLGHADKAVPILDALVSTEHGGTISIATVRTDVDYDPIRNTPEFKQLLQRYASVHY